jgi:hypothetical protein
MEADNPFCNLTLLKFRECCNNGALRSPRYPDVTSPSAQARLAKRECRLVSAHHCGRMIMIMEGPIICLVGDYRLVRALLCLGQTPSSRLK